MILRHLLSLIVTLFLLNFVYELDILSPSLVQFLSETIVLTSFFSSFSCSFCCGSCDRDVAAGREEWTAGTL